MLADRDAARGDEDVGREPALERFPQRLLVVRDRRRGQHLGARGGERGGEHERVRLVDLAGRERLARRDELAARWRAPRRAAGARSAARRRRTAAAAARRAGVKPRAGGNDDLPGRNVSAPRADVRPASSTDCAISTVLSFLDNVLDRNDCVRLLRHDRARRDGDGSAGLDRSSRTGCPAADSPTTRSVPARRMRVRRSRPSRSSRTAEGRPGRGRLPRATRPPASAIGTSSAGSGRARARTRSCASSRVSSDATAWITVVMRPGDEVAGRYRLDELQGHGPMSEVWRAHDDTLDRTSR